MSALHVRAGEGVSVSAGAHRHARPVVVVLVSMLVVAGCAQLAG
jgi:hypothetical protein